MKGIKRLTRLARRIKNHRSRTRKKRHDTCKSNKRGGKGKFVLPSECTVDGELASKISLMLIDDGPIKDGGPSRRKYTIMLKYDPKCHDVISLSSECTNIGNVDNSLQDLVKAANGPWSA